MIRITREILLLLRTSIVPQESILITAAQTALAQIALVYEGLHYLGFVVADVTKASGMTELVHGQRLEVVSLPAARRA
nr:hypothetical protein [Naumannella halotolerans]